MNSTEPAGPNGSELSERLGALHAKRASATTSANVAIWGSIVCANVWGASASAPNTPKLLIAGVWLTFAALIVWVQYRANRA